MNGMCHSALLNSIRSFDSPHDKRVMPLTVYNSQVIQASNRLWYYWYGMGLLGFSLHGFSDEPRWNIMMGTPGLYHLLGGTVVGTEDRIGVLETTVLAASGVSFSNLGL